MATEAEKKLRADLKIDQKRGLIIATKIATVRAAAYDIELEGGRDYMLPIAWLDGDSAELLDLDGASATFSIHATWAAAADLELTSSAGLLLATSEPNIIVSITKEQIAALERTRAVYVLLVTVGGKQVRLLEGCVTVRR